MCQPRLTTHDLVGRLLSPPALLFFPVKELIAIALLACWLSARLEATPREPALTTGAIEQRKPDLSPVSSKRRFLSVAFAPETGPASRPSLITIFPT